MPLSFVVGATGCSVAATRINRIRRSQRSSHSRPRDAAPFLTHARARARARLASDRDEKNDRAESKLRLSRFLPNFSVGSRSSSHENSNIWTRDRQDLLVTLASFSLKPKPNHHGRRYRFVFPLPHHHINVIVDVVGITFSRSRRFAFSRAIPRRSSCEESNFPKAR